MFEGGSRGCTEHRALSPFILHQEFTLRRRISRKLQLAKGAIAAGIEVLFKEYDCTPFVILMFSTFAGGFGNYIDKASAAK